RTQTNTNVHGSSTCHTQRITQFSDNKTFTLGINHRWPCQVLLSPLHSNPVSLSTLSLYLSLSLSLSLSLPLSLSSSLSLHGLLLLLLLLVFFSAFPLS